MRMDSDLRVNADEVTVHEQRRRHPHMILIFIAGLVLLGYVGVCVFLYAKQEWLLFRPTKLASDHVFVFEHEFEEYNIEVEEGIALNALLFHADQARGVVYYLHGNAGSLNGWGHQANDFLENGYDFLVIDYRGYGKSMGSITEEVQLYNDVQQVYEWLTERYREDRIIVVGFSIGTAPAAYVASKNAPKHLILMAPYFNMISLAKQSVPFLPGFILRYPLKTYVHLQACAAPVTILHGDEDEIIPYNNSVRLSEYLKEGDHFITIRGAAHNNLSDHEDYKAAIRTLLIE